MTDLAIAAVVAPNVIDSAPQAAIEPRSAATGSLFRAHASGFTGGEEISI